MCGSLCLSFLALGQVGEGLPVAQLSLPCTVRSRCHQRPCGDACASSVWRLGFPPCACRQTRSSAGRGRDLLLQNPVWGRLGHLTLQGETHRAAGAPMAWSQHGWPVPRAAVSGPRPGALERHRRVGAASGGAWAWPSAGSVVPPTPTPSAEPPSQAGEAGSAPSAPGLRD